MLTGRMSGPTFNVRAKDGQARVGQLVTKHGSIPTPTVLVYTRRGGPLCMTPDLLEKLDPTFGIQANVLQFLSSPDPATLAAFGRGAHEFLSLPQTAPLIATNRDPTLYEYGARPNTDAGAYATIHAGGVVASVDKYMSAVAALQPDLYVTLCDEITCTSDLTAKRQAASVTRTAKWLDACLSAHSSKKVPVHTGALAAIPGGANPEERARAAKAAADKPVTGFALCGFGTGESPSERARAVEAAVAQLPEDKPRLISGLATPEAVLEGVSQGLDIFDDSYITQATTGGYALIFPTQQAAAQGSDAHAHPAPDAKTGTDATKMNLWSVEYRVDKLPVLPGCSCYTCSRHSRSYIHHLLQVNEMLAHVLLEVHNTHHYQGFMAAVRTAVEARQLAQYRAWFSALGVQSIDSSQAKPLGQGNSGKRPAGAAGEQEGGAGAQAKRQAV